LPYAIALMTNTCVPYVILNGVKDLGCDR